jgi:YD repeat-containing protein
LYQTWNGSAWVNSYQNTYTYDANNNLTSELDQDWNGSAWENSSQYIYTYDANNNLTSELWQDWNGSAWVNSSQYIYTYDANNNLTSEMKLLAAEQRGIKKILNYFPLKSRGICLSADRLTLVCRRRIK